MFITAYIIVTVNEIKRNIEHGILAQSIPKKSFLQKYLLD